MKSYFQEMVDKFYVDKFKDEPKKSVFITIVEALQKPKSEKRRLCVKRL